ncbi:MAG TPA: glycosyltransferase, partial [Nitrospira sp.]
HATSNVEVQSAQERFTHYDVVLIPNGVEIPEQAERSEGASGSLHMLYLGRLDPIKGIENLLFACSQLSREQGISWRLTIAGAGEACYVASLERLIITLEIQHQVHMVGEVKRNSIALLFEQADLVVVPSYSENFGMVVAEALAHGLPVIASKGTPWSGLVRRGCGLWVDNSPDSLAEAVGTLHKSDMHRMGLAGREWMKESYSWEMVATQMYKSYQSIM